MALIERLQPYHKGPSFAAYALSIVKHLNNFDKHRALILHVVVVSPNVRVSLADAAGGDEVMTAEFDDVSEDVRPGADMMGFAVTDVRRELITDVAFAQFGTAKNQSVVTSVSFLYRYVRDIVERFRPLV